MRRAVFDPNVNGLFDWPETWAIEVETALFELTRTLGVNGPNARVVRGVSTVYALLDEVIVGVAWVEPEFAEGRVVGLQLFIGTCAGSA